MGLGFLAKGVLDGMNGDTNVIATQVCSPDEDNCEVRVDGQLIKLSLTSKNGSLHSGQKTNTVVSTPFGGHRPIQISLQGKTMYMGENHFPLIVNEHNNFVNNIHFPVCVTGQMTWQAIIKFDNNDSIIFEFDAQ